MTQKQKWLWFLIGFFTSVVLTHWLLPIIIGV